MLYNFYFLKTGFTCCDDCSLAMLGLRCCLGLSVVRRARATLVVLLGLLIPVAFVGAEHRLQERGLRVQLVGSGHRLRGCGTQVLVAQGM